LKFTHGLSLHTQQPILKQRTKQVITQNMSSEPTWKAHLQLLGELANDPLAFLGEEGDDLGNEFLFAPVREQKLLLELLVQQTLT
jgi:hypothetical protein